MELVPAYGLIYQESLDNRPDNRRVLVTGG